MISNFIFKFTSPTFFLFETQIIYKVIFLSYKELVIIWKDTEIGFAFGRVGEEKVVAIGWVRRKLE